MTIASKPSKAKTRTVTDETREKMAEARRGKPLSEEHRARLSAAAAGIPKRADTCRRMSIGTKLAWARISPEKKAERLRKMAEGKKKKYAALAG